ncbi:hypothetical protein FQA39_LY15799 [Lamprigera yunnana]|nr:hypothetical protein FQA39_LY15799 [Lamprigera yunnana]
MASNEFDYEAIIKVLKQNDATTEEYELKKKVKSAFENILFNYHAEKIKYDVAESINTEKRMCISNSIQLNENITEQLLLQDEKLQNYQDMCLEVATKKQNIILNYCNEMRIISNNIKELPREFNVEKIEESITQYNNKNWQEELNSIKQNINNLKEILSIERSFETANVDQLQKTLEKEMLSGSEDTLKVQNQLPQICLTNMCYN